MKSIQSSKKDEAVSPVVGVMLMLVVTIIIAAVVVAFSSGLIDTKSSSPSAYFDVKINAFEGDSNDQYVMTIEHLGGEVVDTAELQIVTYYSYSGYDSTTQTAVNVRKTATITPGSATIKLDGTNFVRVPYLADIAKGSPGDATINFGMFELTSGDIMTSGNSLGTATMLGFTNADDISTGNTNGFGVGSKVEVSIIHTPSGNTIFNKEVRVA